MTCTYGQSAENPSQQLCRPCKQQRLSLHQTPDRCFCLQVCQLEARCRALERQVDELMQSWDEDNPDSQFVVRVSAWPGCACHGL